MAQIPEFQQVVDYWATKLRNEGLKLRDQARLEGHRDGLKEGRKSIVGDRLELRPS